DDGDAPGERLRGASRVKWNGTARRRAQSGPLGYALAMKAIVIGCGRVGSSIARQLDREGWEVVAVDEKEEALGRLGQDWAGGFVVGHGMDTDLLREAGIEEAEAVVVATNGH